MACQEISTLSAAFRPDLSLPIVFNLTTPLNGKAADMFKNPSIF
jgi:hypothetical protein